jgi:hypothetical protein
MFELLIYPVLLAFFSALIAWFFARESSKHKIKAMAIENDKLKLSVEGNRLDNEIKSAKYYQDLLDDMSTRLEKAIVELMASEERHRSLMEVNRELVTEIQKFKQLNGKG